MKKLARNAKCEKMRKSVFAQIAIFAQIRDHFFGNAKENAKIFWLHQAIF